jgi:hypothetical protein
MYVLKNRLIHLVQQGAGRLGLVVRKATAVVEDQALLGALLAEAAAAEAVRRGFHKPTKKGAPEATGVIFSFNRPIQLELLLRSYLTLGQNPVPLVVQYGAKGEAFKAAYAEVAALYPQVTWVAEEKFRPTLEGVLAGLQTPKVFFLVDDIVFIRPTDMAAFAALPVDTAVPSLRLAPTLNYSYTSAQAQQPPRFAPAAGGMLSFKWGEQWNEWSYPMSVDGHLFSTAEVCVMARVAPYKAPNSFEGALMRFAPSFMARQGLCFAEPQLFNNPCNKVQSEVANLAGTISPESLLARWQAGERLALAPYLDLHVTAPHMERELVFEHRPR